MWQDMVGFTFIFDTYKHCVPNATTFAPVELTTPPVALAMETDKVLGPEITNV